MVEVCARTNCPIDFVFAIRFSAFSISVGDGSSGEGSSGDGSAGTKLHSHTEYYNLFALFILSQSLALWCCGHYLGICCIAEEELRVYTN